MAKAQNVKYDLEERTSSFSLRLLSLLRKFNETSLNRNIISQLLRSGTSIGANYSEANDSSTKKDFLHKISICRKEAKETKYWLKLLKSEAEYIEEIDELLKEAQELNLIFAAIVIRSKK